MSSSPDFAIFVPARLASERFPRKLLHPVRGVPLVLWTARRLAAVAPDFPVIFAVDGEELAAPLQAEGYRVVLTDPELPSGTDRIAAANAEVSARRVINVQADEPLVAAAHILALRRFLEDGVEMATLAAPFQSASDFLDPNKVKVVCDTTGRALTFSRAPIPWSRDRAGQPRDDDLAGLPALLHLGLYGYTADALARFVALPPGRLERTERLEQLRALEAGWTIRVATVKATGVGIDTPEDVADFEARLDESSA